jgi:hypothetical protein
MRTPLATVPFAAMVVTPEAACAGERIPRRVGRRLDTVERLLARAAATWRPRRVSRLARRADRTVRTVARLVERAARGRRRAAARISAGCAASLRAVVSDLRGVASRAAR